jgi:hypothetical protein
MSWCRRMFAVGAVIGVGLLTLGCAKDQTTLPQSRDTPLWIDVPNTPTPSHSTRLQRPDLPQPPPLAAPQSTEVQPVSGSFVTGIPDSIDGRFSVRVRAWVNNKAIFDDEVRNRLPREQLLAVMRMPPEQRDAEMQKLFQATLDNLIEGELLKQDALRKLAKNPKYLEKILTESARESEKQIRAIIKSNGAGDIESFKVGLEARGTTLESLRNQFERDFIAGEYLKVLIYPRLRVVNHEAIRDYYDQHLNEYQRVERIKWHDIFIAVGPNHPTMAHARQLAEQLVECWRNGEDISKLTQFDDGEARYRKGEGSGELKGQIMPRELEPYLFAMKEGEIGPLVELSTGIHIFRLIKHEPAGVIPFDEKIQQSITNKLKGDMFERERKGIVRELREKANIFVDRPTAN